MRHQCALAVLALTVATTACRVPTVRQAPAGETADTGSPPRITHGVSVGDVTSTSAVLWARCDRAATLHFKLYPDVERAMSVRATAARDFTAKFEIDRLQPD